MDLGEDADLQVQRASPELIADLTASLEPFLWRHDVGNKHERRIRRRVRKRETERIVALLEPFQELPQLLDPHLQNLVPILAEAFVASLLQKTAKHETRTKLLMPVSRAICKLLYTFCKIRGEKVIVRFLSTDTKHLELLLSAIELGDPHGNIEAPISAEVVIDPTLADDDEGKWEWEERYITLLWLSQLLLAPFDLSTISSEMTQTNQPDVPGLVWPVNAPGITLRVVPLAVRYLKSSGKERDAAKILLVRIAMRRDMQELGVFNALVKWSLSFFSLSSTSEAKSSYEYIGVLSFLAGILNASMSTSDMDPYLSTIFQTLQGDLSHEISDILSSSVVAKKSIIKVLRNICIIVLRNPNSTEELLELVETTIGFMLESLSDAATPVRLAASKALSLITLKLPDDMAAQVVEEVIASLKRDVLPVITSSQWTQDLSQVNPGEWHGLILTLSQLLYRRSPPAESLSNILPALLSGLSFEQRSTSGSSVGTNVRDAACFGIWALARRYTTSELLAINTTSAGVYERHGSSSVLQVLATELVVSACLDPAGNIRRGSSAALQELIGRHPNTISEGISVVQVVDYHAIALRSRAVVEVAFQAAQLSQVYLTAILHGLLGWRGVGDADASARRTASSEFGRLSGDAAITTLTTRLQELRPREDDERHGILLCLASCLTKHHQSFDLRKILDYANNSKHRRPDLIAEAVSRLIISVVDSNRKDDVLILALLSKWLRRTEQEVISAASEAATVVFEHLEPLQRERSVSRWLDTVTENQGGRAGQDKGIISVLFSIFPSADSMQASIIGGLHKRWNLGHDILTRAAILQYLATSTAINTHLEDFAGIIADGLDDYTTNARGDVGSIVRIEALKVTGAVVKLYNTDQPATKSSDTTSEKRHRVLDMLYRKTLRLAAEKMDKVRVEAQQVVADSLSYSDQPNFKTYSSASEQYFAFLLTLPHRIEQGTIKPPVAGLLHTDDWQKELLSGLVGSADAGSEDLIRASRSALACFCHNSDSDSISVCSNLFEILQENIANDRILVPTLEIIGFLFDVQIMQRSKVDWRSLYMLVQKSHFKTGNVRKLEAAIRLYGALSEVYPPALQKLKTMVLHPFPKIRNQVIDTLFSVKGVGKGVNWLKASKADLIKLE